MLRVGFTTKSVPSVQPLAASRPWSGASPVSAGFEGAIMLALFCPGRNSGAAVQVPLMRASDHGMMRKLVHDLCGLVAGELQSGAVEAYLLGDCATSDSSAQTAMAFLQEAGLHGSWIDCAGQNCDRVYFVPSKGALYLRKKKPAGVAAKAHVVSSRAMNPLGKDDRPEDIFCDSHQATATTATRMFRNEDMFRAVREIVVPHYLERTPGRGLSIWSAGCSSGEEPYSLAMVAASELDERECKHLQVFGTDINRELLGEAKAGYYICLDDKIPEKYRPLMKRYSVPHGSQVRICDQIRGMMRFGFFDLRERPRKHRFNMIVCNHVFQYYSRQGQTDILDNLCYILKPGGCLYLEGVAAGLTGNAGLKKVPGYRYVYSM